MQRNIIVTLPSDLDTSEGGAQVWVREEFGATRADVRPDPKASWVPIEIVGGSIEVREE